MSGEIVFRIGRIAVGDICSIGYATWFVYVRNPRRSHGLFLEIGVPNHHLEIRWL
jgi:hypothetical protein